MGDAKEYQLALSPPWLLGTYGEAWMLVMGLLKEAHIEASREAVVQRFVTYCAADGLDEHGQERQIPRAPGETVEQYRARLMLAWEAWQRAGTPAGILLQLTPAGVTNASIVEHASIDPSISSSWAVWHMVVEMPHPFVDPVILGPAPVGSGRRLGDGSLLGFGSAHAIEYVRAVIKKWNAVHTTCTGLAIYDTTMTYTRRLPVPS